MTEHVEKMRQVDFLLQSLPRGRHRHDPARALGKADGVLYFGGHKGIVPLGDDAAELDVGVDGSLRIRAGAALSATPLDALLATNRLPGNLRYARDRQGEALVADTQIDGVTHLPQTLQVLRGAMLRTLQSKADAAPDAAPDAVDHGAVREALAGLPWAGDGVVEQDDGWELRPRLRGDAVPVRMMIEPGGLWLGRVVLHQLPGADTAACRAVADQAVRINACLRHARLAVAGGRLVAEARLEAWLVQPDWLATAAWAVAVAARHAATPLRLLAEQPAVADTYIMMFCSTVEQPTPHGVGG